MVSISNIPSTPRSNATFPGFNNGGHICDVLTKRHNPDLKAFTTEFFRQVSEANQCGREERYVAKDRKFFDAMAQILTGNEVCAAVAISKSDILIATNVGTHDQRAVQWHLTTTVIDTDSLTRRLRLRFTCHLSSKTGIQAVKHIGPLEYQFHCRLEKAVLRDSGKLSFSFSTGDFPYLPDDEVEVNMSIYHELDYDFFCFLLKQKNGAIFSLQTPIVTCRGSLKRRAAKLFNLLSFIAKPILKKLPWLPQSCKSQHVGYSRFVETEYQQYKQLNQQRSEDAFIQRVRAKCCQFFRFDQEGGDTTEDFL